MTLSAEKALREGGDKADFDEESYHGFQGGEGGDGTGEREWSHQEAASVKGGDAKYEGFT